ncbi:hypothetical protein [Humisphaera borealis]|uniref:CD-NTase-associated protein 12/Pycsar effector protein TIR domain-containing protein n=1 Tax=Humisphaera borealis TaxID=2807512 RepID=A0A7M2WS58_9BACT|nr:hypothetical protein [Humisphaera borealis]QOV88347.1 hypothetical protein IPV69_19140 [Humisphaera borealis]
MSATPEATPTMLERAAPQSASGPAHSAGSQPQPLRLTLQPGAAAKQIVPWLSRGIAIRKHRLRDLTDLDKARSEKKAWVAAYTDLLSKLFDGPAVAEACNDWIGRLLPEYAPLGLVIEQFYEEMDHRLRRLQAVVDHLEDMAEESPPVEPASGTAQPSAGQAAAKKDEPKGKSLNWARLFPTAEELTGQALPLSEQAVPKSAHTDGPNGRAAEVTSSASGSGGAAHAKSPEHKAHAAPGTLPPVVKPVGLLLVQSADDAKPICEFLTDLAVTPRVVLMADAKPNDPELLMSGTTAPAFALIWPCEGDAVTANASRFQFQLGFLVGRLGLSRVCLMQTVGKPAESSPVPAITLDAHGGWQLPLARTLKRAGVAVDLNRLC